MQIKFSHKYPKLHEQTSARLLTLAIQNKSDLSEKFLEYDTAYEGGHYPLKDGKYMVLVFLGNELIPFTTVRSYSEEKFEYYKSGIGATFKIGYAPGVI